MNKTLSYTFVGFTLSLLLFASCGEQKRKDSSRTDTRSSGAISFASDESFSPLIEDERQVFQGIHPQAKVTPVYTSESEGVQMLLDGNTCLVITSRNFKDSELKNLKDRKFMPRSFKLAYDGLALIVNKNNTDTCISVNDLKRILSGEAKNWSDIYEGSTRGEIELVFDNPKSSAVHYCEDSLLNGKPIESANVSAVKKTQEVINYVEKTPGAIGIIASNWITNINANDAGVQGQSFLDNIRVMRVTKLPKATPDNSWLPYQYYILNGNYPLVRTIWALVNDPYNALPSSFAQFIESPKGQMVVLKAGLLPVVGEINVRNVNVTQ